MMINPSIVWSSKEVEPSQEGCLSLPGMFVNVNRSVACDVEYVDIGGLHRSIRCTGFQAKIVQHEIDHLLGITMLDKVGHLIRRLALKN